MEKSISLHPKRSLLNCAAPWFFLLTIEGIVTVASALSSDIRWDAVYFQFFYFKCFLLPCSSNLAHGLQSDIGVLSVLGFTTVARCALTITFCPVLSYNDFSPKLEKSEIVSIMCFEESLCSSFKKRLFLSEETWAVNLTNFFPAGLDVIFNHLGLWQGLSDSVLILHLSHQRSSVISKLGIVKAIVKVSYFTRRGRCQIL